MTKVNFKQLAQAVDSGKYVDTDLKAQKLSFLGRVWNLIVYACSFGQKDTRAAFRIAAVVEKIKHALNAEEASASDAYYAFRAVYKIKDSVSASKRGRLESDLSEIRNIYMKKQLVPIKIDESFIDGFKVVENSDSQEQIDNESDWKEEEQEYVRHQAQLPKLQEKMREENKILFADQTRGANGVQVNVEVNNDNQEDKVREEIKKAEQVIEQKKFDESAVGQVYNTVGQGINYIAGFFVQNN